MSNYYSHFDFGTFKETLRVRLIKKLKMIENTTNFYEKLEKEISDLVRCSITFLVFPWNPNLWAMGKKMFP